MLSQRAFKALGFKPGTGHLDTTTLSAHGKYNSAEENVEGLHITQGYSKDNRPDLPQATLQLICEHLGGIPVHMEALNGNSNDSESFRQAIETYGRQLHAEDGVQSIIADSKLYSKETLQVLEENRMGWSSRVPGTLKEAKGLLRGTGLDRGKLVGCDV
ncbi:MAG: IS1634 family transposase [Bacteroidetes bacterium]|nr:IS1634 family transposase [Bacteroidota bacterium]